MSAPRRKTDPSPGRWFPSRPGLVVYVTCGDPSLAASRRIVLAAIDAGADVIELGVPFSDPLADGPVIQRASDRAVRAGVTLADVLGLARDVKRRRPGSRLVIFSYVNPVMRFGLERFARVAGAAGVDGVLLTDLTVEESAEYRARMRRHGLATIFLAAPTSPDARLRKIAAASSGFLYAVSRTGITGTHQQADLKGETMDLVRRIRRFSDLPVAVGFGISTPQQFREVGRFADAAVVGSAVVRRIEAHPGREAEAVGGFLRRLKGVG
jgi:tryptophan synthase alpha chain